MNCKIAQVLHPSSAHQFSPCLGSAGTYISKEAALRNGNLFGTSAWCKKTCHAEWWANVFILNQFEPYISERRPEESQVGLQPLWYGAHHSEVCQGGRAGAVFWRSPGLPTRRKWYPSAASPHFPHFEWLTSHTNGLYWVIR